MTPMNEGREFFKWLYPGIRVKRAIPFMALGIIVMLFGLAYLLPELTEPFGRLFLRTEGSAPRYWGYWVLRGIGIGFLLVGYVFIVYGVRQIGREVARVISPSYEPKLGDVMHRRSVLAAGIRIVALGGGTGLSTLLRGVKEHTSNITAVVTVTDDGGSSGRLTKELGVIPPGDIRNCITALAESESLMTELMSYRFDERSESLKGHSLGNLLIAAMSEVTGDFERAVRATSDVLAIRGRVLPSSKMLVRLRGRLSDGVIVEGETNIAAAPQAIETISLVPDAPPPLDDTLEAIAEASIICIGPGSVYTSIIPNLLVPGVAEAIEESGALKILVVNVMTQPGETDGYTASDHCKVIQEHAGRRVFDYVLVNTRSPGKQLLDKYARERQFVVAVDSERIEDMGFTPITGDFISETDYVRHDPVKLADAILSLAAYGPPRRSSGKEP
jgi:uncharacterized cofD-like protein